MEKKDSHEKLLDTEGGMFILELEGLLESSDILIAASNVNDELKSKCREILKNLGKRANQERDKTDTYDLARVIIINLLYLLDQNDPEQKSLFEALRGVIWESVSSAKGW